MSVWHLGSAWSDEAALTRAWQHAEPFPHLVFDDFVRDEGLSDLLAIVEEEGVEHYQADFYAFDATPPEPKTEALRVLRETFAKTLAEPLSRITLQTVRRADMRVYAYRPGDFLLPHSDHQLGVGRMLAYAYYLPTPDPPTGGELELYRCTIEAGEVVSTETARLIEARPNRLVVFGVNDVSLHQVREVLSGLRVSLSGWFYA